jgi:hypothetical protein
MLFTSRRKMCAATLLFFSSSLATSVMAQELLSTTSTTSSTPSSGESSCFGSAASVPSRPTVANATDTTQCGVVELEYGLERQWPGGGANRDDLSGGLRFGLTPKLDFHWSSSEFVHLMNGGGDRTGYGDNWLGLKYRFLGQTRHRPALGVFYDAKVPSASVALGLGSGKVDHAISFLASKDVRKVHFDFNVIELVAGRSAATGFDHNTGFALAAWVPVTKRLTGVVEPYGYNSLNPGNPAFASAMVGFNYKVQPRVYVDGGLDLGVTHDAPHKRVYVGITYAMANLYSWMKPR